jgi:hypothetical protein
LESLTPTKEVIMRKIVAVVSLSLLAGALPAASSLAVEAAQSPAPHAARSTALASSKTKASKPAAHTVSGILESYDAAGKTLTVKGSSTWTFDAGAARVWEGSKSVGIDELSSQTGAKVTVKYLEHGGQKAAQSIRLAPAHVKTAKSK